MDDRASTSHQRAFRLSVVLATAVVVVGLDRYTKHLATVHLYPHKVFRYLGDSIRLHYAENTGGFLSLGSELPPALRTAVFVGFVGIALVITLYVLLSRRDMGRGQVAALSLILAGGVSNLYDRIAYDGIVVDFMNVGIGPVRTGVFNVADMAIMAGIGVLAVGMWRDRHRDTPDREPSPSPMAGDQRG